MNRVLKICCLLYVCVLSFSTGVAQVVDTARWDLNRISSWMLTQIQPKYLQLIIPQYFISNKSGIWSLSLIVHSKG